MSETVYQRLDSLQHTVIKLGLRNITQLLEALGRPDHAWPSVLIAGTNGKGSAGAMLEAMLRIHGIRTGHYTSPHLVRLHERIRVAGRVIQDADLVSALETVFHAIDEGLGNGSLESHPTFFEVLTAAAFLHFQRARVEYAVVEVGLGGRFDATNAIEQKLSVITNIDFDHQEYLGHSLDKIAGEKAGILKQNVPLVTGVIEGVAFEVIRQAAESKQCNITALRPEMMEGLKLLGGFPVFWFKPWERTVRVGLRGEHQAVNAGLALLAADGLRAAGVPLTHEKCLNAMETVRWPGRLDLIANNPPVLTDCAHNPNGVDSLARFLQDMGWNKVNILFTAMRDKNIAVMLSRIAPHVDTAFLTRVEPLGRCAGYEELAGGCLTAHIANVFKEDCATAYKLACEDSVRKQLPLVVFGSVYLIGTLYQILNLPI